MRSRVSAAFLVVLLLAACQGDMPTTTSELQRSAGGAGRATTSVSGSPTTCPTCAFEPRVFTRSTATPATEVVEFAGNPAGAYIIEISDLGTLGANASVTLNSQPLNVRSGQLRQDVTLGLQNVLTARLTGKPGSQLSVRVFQEVASVTVTPSAPRSRIPATQQFTAVAKDKNGVVISGQTFTWEALDVKIATINAATGLARTKGGVYGTAAWTYKMNSSGEGAVQIVAHPDGTPDKSGSATWTVVQGFVYTTYQAALPLNSPNRASRPTSVPYHYDVPRLHSMSLTCLDESSNTAWRETRVAAPGERQFKQCYPSLEVSTPTRVWVAPTALTPGFYIYGNDGNVGLYGRYCGAGQPDGEWYHMAQAGNYAPIDPIDAMCMEHDKSLDLHELDPFANAAATACIVRYGIEKEELHEEGVRIQPGTARWNAFWDAWPDMANARGHWLREAGNACFGPIYTNFLNDRGLTL